jgi:hypothetical protein
VEQVAQVGTSPFSQLVITSSSSSSILLLLRLGSHSLDLPPDDRPARPGAGGVLEPESIGQLGAVDLDGLLVAVQDGAEEHALLALGERGEGAGGGGVGFRGHGLECVWVRVVVDGEERAWVWMRMCGCSSVVGSLVCVRCDVMVLVCGGWVSGQRERRGRLLLRLEADGRARSPWKLGAIQSTCDKIAAISQGEIDDKNIRGEDHKKRN